ncbi:bactofilin family protein [Salinibacter grassmerensis]|uniref:bactofilin family protein n=1 Tax=Salinibacter grassmerensis TaxID=3040353 RepID=UPI0021E8AE76|nr:polymer-forming cytoskeletal protein [Salinibacter grassmerensis]
MFDFFQRSTDDDDASGPSSALSVLGEDTTARGTFNLKEDDLRVDGVLDGDVTTEGHVHVSKEGTIHGEIQAGSIRIAGDAEGVLHAQTDLVVMETASVHGILCAEALTIEDEANFEGGLCDTADRIPALKEAFFSTETYAIPALSSSPDEPPADSSGQPSEAADRSVTLDIEPSSSPENTTDGNTTKGTAPVRPLQEGDGLPESPSSSAAPDAEQSAPEPDGQDAEDTDDVDTLSTIEW